MIINTQEKTEIIVDYIKQYHVGDIMVVDNEFDKYCPAGFVFIFPKNGIMFNEKISEVVLRCPQLCFRIDDNEIVSCASTDGNNFIKKLNEENDL